MTVTSIKPISKGRGGATGKDNRSTYTRSFVVQTDDAYDEWAVIKAAIPIRIGDPYTNGAGKVDQKCFCVRQIPEQQSDRHVWHVHCEHEPQDRQRTVIRGSYEKKKKAVVGLRSTDPYPQQPSNNDQYLPDSGKKKSFLYTSQFSNSFGDPFDPAPEYEVSYPVVTYRRREENANFPLWNHFKDAVNEGWWSGANPRCAKVMSIDFEHEYVYELGVEKKIWWVTYKIGFDEDTWDIVKLDAGYHFNYETGNAEGETAGKEGTFFDKDGVTPRIGLLSNEAGAAGIKGIRLVDLTKPEFISFDRIWPQRNFSQLGLPENINIFEPA